MTNEEFYTVCRMFKHACAFVDCAVFCVIEPKHIKVGAERHTTACIVNSAFACEVFIKSLLVYNGFSIDEIKGHKLRDLWDKYKRVDCETANLVEQKMQEIFDSDNENMFNELLDNISNAFEYWRYIYERRGGSINIGFLVNFRDLLRAICCDKYYHMSWDDYLER